MCIPYPERASYVYSTTDTIIHPSIQLQCIHDARCNPSCSHVRWVRTLAVPAGVVVYALRTAHIQRAAH